MGRRDQAHRRQGGVSAPRNLTELRGAIDALDAEIAPLLARRIALACTAARFKNGTAEAAAPARAAQVVERVRTLAGNDAVTAEILAATYRTMIAGIVAEEERRLKP